MSLCSGVIQLCARLGVGLELISSLFVSEMAANIEQLSKIKILVAFLEATTL
jgi:hypothetical protein